MRKLLTIAVLSAAAVVLLAHSRKVAAVARQEQLYVGWVRTGWRHWQACTLPPKELLEVAELLKRHKSKDVDGEHLILPEGMRPVHRPVQEQP